MKKLLLTFSLSLILVGGMIMANPTRTFAADPLTCDTGANFDFATGIPCPPTHQPLVCATGYFYNYLTGERCPVGLHTSAPFINFIIPSPAPVGSQITISGGNFGANNLVVHFGQGIIPNAPINNNGTSITFAVPDFIGPACLYANPSCDIASTQVTNGIYPIFVSSDLGTSNTVNFTVGSGSGVTQFPPPTASLTANAITNHSGNGTSDVLTVNVGDTIHYQWNSTYGGVFSSNYTNSCTRGTNAPWSAHSNAGTVTGVVQPNQAGCTYVITYTVAGVRGNATASVTIQVNGNGGPSSGVVPTASLTANGSHDLTVNVGDTVSFAWSSVNANSTQFYYGCYYTSGGGYCGEGNNWPVQGSNGTLNYTTTALNAGKSYSMVFTAINGTEIAQDTLILRVNAVGQWTSPPPPTSPCGPGDIYNIETGEPCPVTPPPTSNSISPTSGPIGTTVTIHLQGQAQNAWPRITFCTGGTGNTFVTLCGVPGGHRAGDIAAGVVHNSNSDSIIFTLPANFLYPSPYINAPLGSPILPGTYDLFVYFPSCYSGCPGGPGFNQTGYRFTVTP